MKLWSTIFYVLSFISVSMGFYKMYVYENYSGTFVDDSYINAYVGSDAHNMIINSNYATAYFVLAMLFMLLGCFTLIYGKLSDIQANKKPTKPANTTKIFENVQTYKQADDKNV